MTEPAWHNLELHVARYLRSDGYSVRTNHKERGQSGSEHEIDVFAEKRDAAGQQRAVVECKAWRSPIAKE